MTRPKAFSVIPALKLRRSLGVPVTTAVHRVIRAAGVARDGGRWDEAARLCRDALDLDPGLAHIWVQYGHMLRELGNHAVAETAYLQARDLGHASDALLHLGHLYKETGQIERAARTYLEAARASPRNADAVAELHAMMERGIAITAEDLMSVIQSEQDLPMFEDATLRDATQQASAAITTLKTALLREDRGTSDAGFDMLEATSMLLDEFATQTSAQRDADHNASPAIVFDVSDLISYFRDARSPTGIQRVQIEIIHTALETRDIAPVLICAFLEYRDEWIEIPYAMFRALSRTSLESGDRSAPDWVALMTRVRLAMTVADPLVFPRGAFLINLGTSWWLQNYFLYVRKAKAEYGIRYVPFVHDLIPIMASEHCTRELTQDFINWAIGAFVHADLFLVNSEATKRDLLTVADYLGHDLSPDAVTVIHLDADSRKPAAIPGESAILSRWGLRPGHFVLFVSTIESRKNHLGAFDAWIDLIRKHGIGKMPFLVCVGNRGWLNDAIYARLNTHEALRSRVIMLSGLSDAELDLLYRSCLFTLYPSNYEGWGLPVTESLCYGKVPVISDTSSLPEAGGPFAQYFEAGSTPQLTNAVETMIFDAPHRQAMERKIATEYRPRRWDEISDQIATTLRSPTDCDARESDGNFVALARPVAYHPIIRNYETRIWPGLRSGEVYRVGAGWWGPDDWGCWTKPGGGALAIAIPNDAAVPIRFYLQIHGLPARDCEWTLRIDATGMAIAGKLKSGAFKWVTFDIADLPADRILRMTISGDAIVDLRTITDGGDPRIVSIGVAGFFYCAVADGAARATLLEAVALGNLGDLAFNREPITAPGAGSGIRG